MCFLSAKCPFYIFLYDKVDLMHKTRPAPLLPSLFSKKVAYFSCCFVIKHALRPSSIEYSRAIVKVKTYCGYDLTFNKREHDSSLVHYPPSKVCEFIGRYPTYI